MTDNWPDRFINWATTSGVRIIAIILIAVIFYFVLRGISRRLLHLARKVGERSDLVSREQEARAKTLAGIIRGLIIILITVVVLLMVLNELGYNVAPLLAGAGIAGIALGLGAQTLVRDMIGGFFILLESQFNVGDVVKVSDITGRVEAIKLRTTLIRDSEGVLHIVPNGEMRMVANLTKGWSRVNVDIDFNYLEDIDRVIKAIEGSMAGLKDVPEAVFITGGPTIIGVEKIEGAKVTLRVVAQTEPFKDAEVARAMRKLIAKGLAQDRITLSE